jgi:hypothetical protein
VTEGTELEVLLLLALAGVLGNSEFGAGTCEMDSINRSEFRALDAEVVGWALSEEVAWGTSAFEGDKAA